jgi:hypothetical protein
VPATLHQFPNGLLPALRPVDADDLRQECRGTHLVEYVEGESSAGVDPGQLAPARHDHPAAERARQKWLDRLAVQCVVQHDQHTPSGDLRSPHRRLLVRIARDAVGAHSQAAEQMIQR